MCGLACTCVFAKQSLGPIICDPPQQPGQARQPQRASLLPKLRDQYAEFLDHVSLVHLRLLASPTCVGFRYGHQPASPKAFLARRLHPTCPFPRERTRIPVSACAYAVKRPSTRPPGLRSGVPLGFNTDWRGQNFHWTTHRLRLWGLDLGTASPCADCHGAGTLGFTVSQVFTGICAYSFRHPHFSSLHDNGCPGRFAARRTLPYPSHKV